MQSTSQVQSTCCSRDTLLDLSTPLQEMASLSSIRTRIFQFTATASCLFSGVHWTQCRRTFTLLQSLHTAPPSPKHLAAWSYLRAKLARERRTRLRVRCTTLQVWLSDQRGPKRVQRATLRPPLRRRRRRRPAACARSSPPPSSPSLPRLRLQGRHGVPTRHVPAACSHLSLMAPVVWLARTFSASHLRGPALRTRPRVSARLTHCIRLCARLNASCMDSQPTVAWRRQHHLAGISMGQTRMRLMARVGRTQTRHSHRSVSGRRNARPCGPSSPQSCTSVVLSPRLAAPPRRLKVMHPYRQPRGCSACLLQISRLRYSRKCRGALPRTLSVLR
eukprot:Opistho-2@75308